MSWNVPASTEEKEIIVIHKKNVLTVGKPFGILTVGKHEIMLKGAETMLGRIVKRSTTNYGSIDMILWDHQSDNGYTIMLYPEAKRTTKAGWIQSRDLFCLCLSRFPKGNELEVFAALENGELSIPECWKYFHEPFRDAYILGWTDQEEMTQDVYEQWIKEVEAK